MDTGYPALITEALARPSDPKVTKARSTLRTSEVQGDLSQPDLSETEAPTTPVV
ncbi:MAG: hypothetical protein ACPGYT_01675 [Nitrospirales bacterium]